MKLARKLVFAMLLVVFAMLLTNAFDRTRRDSAALRADIRRDHRMLGRALRAVVPDVWREDGQRRAVSLVEATNQQEGQMEIRWVWPLRPETTQDSLPRAQQLDLRALARGEDSAVVQSKEGTDWLYSYVPVRLHDGRLGAIELSESLASEREQIHATIVRTAISTTVITALMALVTNLLGIWLVGRPVEQLVDKARRVGEGDLSGPLQLRSGDELGRLAAEMNAMCERLETESKARQLALEQLRHAERLSTLGRLAAGVAHELGTPLNVIGMEAKRIVSIGSEQPEVREGAGIITEQAARMTKIISQLLDFARRRVRRPISVDLADVAHESIAMLSGLAARTGISVRSETLSEARTLADRSQLQQVVTNLLMNAIQASSKSSEVVVQTGLSRAPGANLQPGSNSEARAFVRVIDAGTGILEDVLPHVFEPFFTTKDVGQGTGLGLAVAHGIVEEHGGHIDVETQARSGSAFTVWLPAQEAS